MKKVITFLLIVTLFVLVYSEEKVNPREIIEKSTKYTKLKGTESVSTMTIMDNKGHKRIRKVAQISKTYNDGKLEKKLIRFLSPADVKGTGMLTYDYEEKDDDMWLFMPALRKTRRIISSEKSKSFMGSEFSYSDMTPPVLDDFTFEYFGEENVMDVPCWKIAMIPKDDDVADANGYSKKISFISQKTYVIRKAIFYDLDGDLLKEMYIAKVKLLDPENKLYRPIHLEMINKQNNRKSILNVDKIKFNPDVEDKYFTLRYLERQ